jgi:hypothetical protein
MIPWYGIPKKLLNNKIEFLIECRSKNETQYLKNCFWKDIFLFHHNKAYFSFKITKKWSKNLQLFPY